MTVDESSSFRWEDSATDNGVELSHVEATSEYVVAQLDIPFFGWLNSHLDHAPYHTLYRRAITRSPWACYLTAGH